MWALTCSLLYQEPDPRVPGSGKGRQGRHGTGWTPESGYDAHLDCAAADDAGSLPAVVSHDGPPQPFFGRPVHLARDHHHEEHQVRGEHHCACAKGQASEQGTVHEGWHAHWMARFRCRFLRCISSIAVWCSGSLTPAESSFVSRSSRSCYA